MVKQTGSLAFRIQHFLTEELWRIPRKELPLVKSILLKQLRIIVLALRRFSKDKCTLRASALTFYTLLSIVPVLALAFGIAKGFGFEALLQQKIFELFQGQEEVIERAIVFSQSLLDNARGGVIAGIGILVLFWSVVKVLSHIEGSLNDIWGVKKARSIPRKCADYLSIALVFPVLFIISSSVLVLVSGHVAAFTEQLDLLGFFAPAILFILKLLPVMIPVLGLSFVYIFLPNTQVYVRSAMLGGLVGGVFYSIGQALYLYFQLEVSSYGAIYGSFAALPLFLIWLQASWLIVLFGAEISFAEQHVDTYEFEPDASQASLRLRKLLALRICSLCLEAFQRGEPAPSLSFLAQQTQIPKRLLLELIHHLTSAQVLSEVKGSKDDDESCYQPSVDPQILTFTEILRRYDLVGRETLPGLDRAEISIIEQSMADLEREIEHSAQNKPLLELLPRQIQ